MLQQLTFCSSLRSSLVVVLGYLAVVVSERNEQLEERAQQDDQNHYGDSSNPTVVQRCVGSW